MRVIVIEVEMPLNLTSAGEGCEEPVDRYWKFTMDMEASEEHMFTGAWCAPALPQATVAGCWAERPVATLPYDVAHFARLMAAEACKRLDLKPYTEAKLLSCREG